LHANARCRLSRALDGREAHGSDRNQQAFTTVGGSRYMSADVLGEEVL
jgi:hypothetical protein